MGLPDDLRHERPGKCAQLFNVLGSFYPEDELDKLVADPGVGGVLFRPDRKEVVRRQFERVDHLAKIPLLKASDDPHSSDAGIHAASYGGLWQCVIYGFGGLRMVGGTLRVNPKLPKVWKKLSYVFRWKGQTVSVTVTKETLTLKKSDDSEPISLEVLGKSATLKDVLEISMI